MLYQRINRSNPEKIFVIAYNSSATASANGYPVIWDFQTDADGVSFVIPTARATNAGLAICGIAAEGISASTYGLVQVWGYHSATRAVSITGGAPNIAAGSPLALIAAGGNALESINTGADVIQVIPCAFALTAQATFTTAAIAVFIKAL